MLRKNKMGIERRIDYKTGFWRTHDIVELNITPEETNENSYTSIGYRTFLNCRGLETINITGAIDTIDTLAFHECPKLTTINFGDTVKRIKNAAFMECHALEEVNIPDNVETIGIQVFRACTALKSITLGAGITALGDYCFYWDDKLTTITCKATTPPTIQPHTLPSKCHSPSDPKSAHDIVEVLYVPAESIEAYKSAPYWSELADKIKPIEN